MVNQKKNPLKQKSSFFGCFQPNLGNLFDLAFPKGNYQSEIYLITP